ncbi:hypothetical protein [Bradyrhizobium sp. 150]|uniref:hypothetical protein n=1 Tax=Bradyrhizobium sp. 150 TaxID=2782625 RepID=UPI001FFA4639|nr:hypothetical protein [Bradyrhizobium sp. 150]MCK1670338.1 hypothetical protein [Bradyrhizobium sp. 150]
MTKKIKTPFGNVDDKKLDERIKSGAIIEFGWQAFVETFNVPSEGVVHDRMQEAFYYGATHVLSTHAICMSVSYERGMEALISMGQEAVTFASDDPPLKQ